jgi:Predicted ATP-utilizing enzyme (ATP-grasp superfamily)
MYFFVCEFITGGGLQDADLPASLAKEGGMMLSALLTDLKDAGAGHLLTTRDRRLKLVNGDVRTVVPRNHVWDCWRECMADSEVAWIVAPETDGILYELVCTAHQQGCKVIGCTPEAIKLTSSKTKTLEHLMTCNIPCVPVLKDVNNFTDSRYGWVVKPDDGVGAQDCYLLHDRQALNEYLPKQNKKIRCAGICARRCNQHITIMS